MALTEEQHASLRYMRNNKKLRTQMGVSKEFVYKGLEHFLLTHGKWYEVAPWTDEYARGARRQCFGNAILRAATDGLRYVEGLATHEGLAGLPTLHAWNLDAGGKLIDTTWLNTGLCYFGVEFSLGRADDATWNGDSCILDDYKRGHPLFRQRWRGEDFDKVWEPSEGMLMMRDLFDTP